jgi:hypothetical protein
MYTVLMTLSIVGLVTGIEDLLFKYNPFDYRLCNIAPELKVGIFSLLIAYLYMCETSIE